MLEIIDGKVEFWHTFFHFHILLAILMIYIDLSLCEMGDVALIIGLCT